MNPLSALPASPDAGAVPARNAATGTNAAETTDFSTILAGQAMPDATANVGPPVPAPLQPHPATEVPNGKILPPALPLAIAAADRLPAHNIGANGETDGEAPKSAETDEASDQPGSTAIAGNATPAPAVQGLMLPIAALAPTTPLPSEPETAPTNTAPSPPSGRSARDEAAPMPQPPITDARAITGAPKPAMPREGEGIVRLVHQTDLPAPIGAPATISVPLAHPAFPQTAATPAVQPHDFAALVDRLAAAREAVAPQTVAVAVSHGEFGPVRLHFHHEDGALSVTMASADPDFARAVAAAPPVQPVAPASDTAQSQSRDTQPRGFDQSGGQSRGQSRPDQRDDRPARSNPAPPRHTAHGEPVSSGIFA